MNQLDDFEKQLRDQLKGHVAPEPLMWTRLSDALGRAKPWYAKSIFKYALTAVSALTIGAYSSYLYFDSKVSHEQPVLLQTPQEQSNTHNALENSNLPSESNGSNLMAQKPNVSVVDQAQKEQTISTFPTERVYAQAPVQDNQLIEFSKLLALAPNSIANPTKPLQAAHPAAFPNKGSRVGISIASGKMQDNSPTYNYDLGPLGSHQSDISSQWSPLVQLQINLFKNWHFNLGLQQISNSNTEYFQQTEVFSYDDKEHFMFPYLYGFRKISDEELHGGPWPFGPNPPGGPETSVILANYTSQVQTNKLYLPLSLSYHKQLGFFEAQLHAGIGLHFGYNNTQTLTVPGYLPSTILLNTEQLRFYSTFQTQLRLNYLANQHLAVFIEPQFRTALKQQNTIHTQAYRPQTSGIYAGLSWKF